MNRQVLFVLAGLIAAACRPEPQAPAIAAPAADSAPEVRFLAVGRQGYGNDAASRIAAAMERVAAEKPTHGVLYLGDNFYPRGVASITDRQWRTKFESLYDGAHLRGMPFFAILGNHDHDGNPAAELQYAAEQRGSGRWRMDAPYYVRDFGRAGGRVLVRIVFLDAIPMLEQAENQLAFARDAFAATGNPIWRVVASHYAARSLTVDDYTRDRTLTRWLPGITALHADLWLSANDHFQQILDRPDDMMHVSTNGGSDKQDTEIGPGDPATDFTATGPGFATVEFDVDRMTVTGYDDRGVARHSTTRRQPGWASGLAPVPGKQAR